MLDQLVEFGLMALAHQGLDNIGTHLFEVADGAGFLAVLDLDQVIAVFGAYRFGDAIER